MKILVTGGAGYIGSIASEQLCKAGHEVIVFDSIYQGHRAAVPSEADFVEGDLSDRVVDLAQAHILALEALDIGSRVYNLGNGLGFSVNEVVETPRKITGHPIPVQFGARRSGRTRRGKREDPSRSWVEATLPQLHDIIDSAWRWHQAHPHATAIDLVQMMDMRRPEKTQNSPS